MSKKKKNGLHSLKNIDAKEILNLLPEHIWWRDKDGYLLGCNQSQAVDSGYNSPEELIGTTLYDILPQQVADELRRNDLMVMKNGIASTIEEEDYISTKMPLFDEDNNVIGLLGISIHIEDYKNRIDKTHHMLDEIIAAMPGHVYWKDKNCILQGCNEQQALDMGLRSRHEIVGKSNYDILNKNLPEHVRREHAATTNAADKMVMDSDTAKTFEESVVLSSGKEVTYLSQKKPLHDNKGEVVGLLGISVDITELKEAKERAEAANKAKTEFVQNMQHDIRTPAAGLWGVLNVLANAESDPHKKEALEMAAMASKRLLDLCNDAVEFDLGGNTRPIMEKALDVRQLAQSIVELNKPAAFGKNLVLNFKVSAAVPAQIMSDEFRLSRIFVNLIGNAIKFTHKGEVSISLDAIKTREDGRFGVLMLEIKDTGIGIASDKVKSIYDKFSRAVLSNTNKYPGTGLGLYIVKTFVDDLDGDITVQSEENSGTCFKLNIPYKVRWEDMKQSIAEINESFNPSLVASNAKKSPPQIKIEKKSSANKPFTHDILIVEDDKTCLFAEKNVLSAFTDKIDSAETKAEALKKLTEKRYDVVICDLGLPDGSGCDIVAEMRANPKALNHETAFVAMTAHKDHEKLLAAMNAGFSMAETKPLNPALAIEILNIYPAAGTEQPKNEGLPVIDLAVGMQRIATNDKQAAIEALGVLLGTLTDDIPLLQEAEKNNDIIKVRELLHKIRGGLYYSGAPRLEKTFSVLHDEVKHNPNLQRIRLLFSLAYDEVKVLEEQYQALING